MKLENATSEMCQENVALFYKLASLPQRRLLHGWGAAMEAGSRLGFQPSSGCSEVSASARLGQSGLVSVAKVCGW